MFMEAPGKPVKTSTYYYQLLPIMLRIKICGITQLEQGRSITKYGATDLGFICVASSPRYVSPANLQTLVPELQSQVNCIGVFADEDLEALVNITKASGFGSIQLHGQESLEYCQKLRLQLPGREIIKAWRVRTTTDLTTIQTYSPVVDTLLLDAYHPQALGGTGHTLDWQSLLNFQPAIPWFLAGGLNPGNISIALSQLHPQGIDLSSGVEVSPGIKDLRLVQDLFAEVRKKS
jgi:phosphoribosylanthranilate isomerase